MPRMTMIALTGIFALMAVGGTCAPQPGDPGYFVVQTDQDGHDINPGDGECLASVLSGHPYGDELCTLRAAIEESNALGSKTVVEVPAGQYLVHLGTLEMTGSTTVNGAGPGLTTLDGSNLSAGLMLVSESGARATLNRLSVVSGSSCIGNYSESVLTLQQVEVAYCTAAGIINSATLYVRDSLIAHNLSDTYGPTPVGGAGLRNHEQGSASVVRSTIQGNYETSGGGGGIWNAGDLLVDTSTITGNRAFEGGGAILNDGFFGRTTINSSTIAFNGCDRCSFAAGVHSAVGLDSLHVSNTILSDHGDGKDCSGGFVSGGHNLIQNRGSCAISGDTTGNVLGQSPMLLPLTAGLNAFHPIPPNSPAASAGSPATPGFAPACGLLDQELEARPGGERCDIGADEI